MIRPGDGEYLILQNETFTTQDNWSYCPSNSLNDDLEHSIKKAIELNIYIGIPCKDCLNKKEIHECYKDHFNIPLKFLKVLNNLGTFF